MKRRTKVLPIVSWAPRDRERTFCGLDREDYEKVSEVFTGPQTQAQRDATWRDRQTFRDRLKRRLAQSATMELS